MNEKDMKIITHLRKNARTPLTTMSKKTHIPVSTIFDKIKSMEKNQIVRHTTLIDFQKLGYTTRATISIKVDREDKDELKKFLFNSRGVNSIYKINNGYDYMIEGIFKNMDQMEEFIDIMETKFKIIEQKTHFIIKDVKREAFMAQPELLLI